MGLAWHKTVWRGHQEGAESDDAKDKTTCDLSMASDIKTVTRAQRLYSNNSLKSMRVYSVGTHSDSYNTHEDSRADSDEELNSLSTGRTTHFEGYLEARPASTFSTRGSRSYTVVMGDFVAPDAPNEEVEGDMVSRSRPPNYKPFAFRLWYSFILLILLSSILALMGLAMHILPDGTKAVAPVAVIENGTELHAREESGQFLGSPNVAKGYWETPAMFHKRQHGTKDVTTSAQTVDLNRLSASGTTKSQKFSDPVSNTIVSPTDAEKEKEVSAGNFISGTFLASETIPTRGDAFSNRQSQSTTSLAIGSSLTSSTLANILVTCTVTRTKIVLMAGRTRWVPTMTVTVELYTPTKKITATDGVVVDTSLSATTAPPTSANCDVIAVITRTIKKPGHGGFVLAGRNTVTITVPGVTDNGDGDENDEDDAGGDDEDEEEDPPAPGPPSTCYLETITVTDKVDFIATTKTVTIGITILPRAVVVMREPLELPSPQKAAMNLRDCIGGGTKTITKRVAVPRTVIVTVWQTITKNGFMKSQVQSGPLRSSKVATNPTVVITSIVTGDGTVTTRESTVPTKTAQDIRLSMPSKGMTTAVRITTTDERGKSIVTTLMGVYDINGIDTVLPPTTWTDQNGDIVVGTGTEAFNLDHGAESRLDLAQPSLLTLITTLRDSTGRPTLTTSMLLLASLTETTLTNSLGLPTRTEAHYVLNDPQTTVLVDSNREPTGTVTYYLITSLTTMTDGNGRPTMTSTTVYTRIISTITPSSETGETMNGKITLVPASFSSPASTVSTTAASQPTESSNTVLQVYSITEIQYFAGLILPTLVATALTVPIRILDHVAKLYHPFYVLSTMPGGAQAGQSLYWKPMSVWVFITRFQSLVQGDVLLSVTGALVTISSILVPVSAETIRIVLHGEECERGQGNADNCAITVGLFPLPAWIAVAILIIMAMLVLVAIVALRRHQTGIYRRPWSLSEIINISSNPDLQAVLIRIPNGYGRVEDADIMQVLGTRTYSLDYWQHSAVTKYGVVPLNVTTSPGSREEAGDIVFSKARNSPRKAMPFFVFTVWGRIAILLILSGILATIIIYNMTSRETALGQFLSGETTVVRILVTSVGMVITLFWSSFFYCLTFISPYRIAYSEHERVLRVNTKLSTNVFSGLIRALRPSTRDLYLAAVAFIAILADFLPALISNVPYKVIQTWLAHTVCTWITVSILILMLVLVITSFFISWPHMPIDPSTMVGAMYYVSKLDNETKSLLTTDS